MKIFFTAILIVCCALILFDTNASAQTKKFSWETELCEFEGTYDSSKYTDTQLKNTYEMLRNLSVILLETEQLARSYEEIDQLDAAALDEEYKTKYAKLKNLDIVKTEFFENMRQRGLKELKDFYQLSRATMLSYKNPAALKEYTNAEVCTEKYAVPLIAGGDELLNIWKEVNLDIRSKNGSPKTTKEIFDKQFASPDRLKFARLEVTIYGWYNCAVGANNSPGDYNEHLENFNKLFKTVKKIECDEP